MITSLLLVIQRQLTAMLVFFTKCCKDTDIKLNHIDVNLAEIQPAQYITDQKLVGISSQLDRMQADITTLLAAVLPSPAVGIQCRIIMDGSLVKAGTLPMSLIITDFQKFIASVSFVDAKGNPAQVQGAPVWTASDPTLVTIVPAHDGLSAEVLALGPLGTTQVSVQADADLGEGVTNIAGVLDVTIMAGQAVAVNIAASAPVEQ